MSELEKRTAFKPVRTAVIEESGFRFVEVDFALSDGLAEPAQFIRTRVELPAHDHLMTIEAHLEALRVVRNAIGDETARLTRIVDQGR